MENSTSNGVADLRSDNTDDKSLLTFIKDRILKTEAEWKEIRKIIDRDPSSAADIRSSASMPTHAASSNPLEKPENEYRQFSLQHSSEADSGGSTTTSLIPGHPIIKNNQVELAEFVAFFADMRNSTAHFYEPVDTPLIENGLHRIFIETSILIPAIAHVTAQKSGVATELLGDGALILFQVKNGDAKEAIEKALSSANICINSLLQYINHNLWARYKLPPLKIGIGISHSQAIVKVINTNGCHHPKVIGQCIWEAAKLSRGSNTVCISRRTRSLLGAINMANVEVSNVKHS